MSPQPLIASLNLEPAEYDEDWRPTYWPVPSSEDWFQVPDWVPRPVSCMARALYADLAEWGSDDDLELVKRLATDEHLKFVWHELKKKTRTPDHTYLHPG